MADVIVKGMEMPKACGCCCFCTLVPDGDECAINCAIVTEYQKRPNDCPLRPAPEWTSVDYNNPETLPCTEKAILYCAFGRSVGEGCYRGFDGEHHVWKMYAVAGTHWDYEVTHWMPLPEPPEGGDGDG